jgi:hypothetical protein
MFRAQHLFANLQRSPQQWLGFCIMPLVLVKTLQVIQGIKTPAMFRRYDIQHGRDIQRAAEIMEKQIAGKKAISTISSTIDPKMPVEGEDQNAGKVINWGVRIGCGGRI